MGVLGGVGFFVVLIVVILIHEAAHFGVAKRFGFKVDEFFVGFGPKLWSFRRGETEYGIKAIPAGGYVRIAGMNPFQEEAAEDLHRTYGAKPAWQRALVIAAGPTTHFVIAFAIFASWLGMVGTTSATDPVVADVVPTLEGAASPAAGGPLEHPTDVQVVEYTRAHVGTPIPIGVLRDGERVDLVVTPVMAEVDGDRAGRLGVVLALAREPVGLAGAVAGGGRLLGDAIVGTVRSIGQVFGPSGVERVATLLFTDAERRPTDPASVVGISRVAGQAAAAGRFADLLSVLALVNVFIGLLNLVPLPPFDGGHLAVLLVEKLRGRPIDARRVVPIAALVATFLLLFTLSVVWLDIVKPIDLAP